MFDKSFPNRLGVFHAEFSPVSGEWLDISHTLLE